MIKRLLVLLLRLGGVVLFGIGLVLTYPPLREFYNSYIMRRGEINPDRLGDWAVFAGVFLFASLVAFVASYSLCDN